MINREWMGDQVAALHWHHGDHRTIPSAVILQWCTAFSNYTEEQFHQGVMDYLSTPVRPNETPWPGAIKQRIIEQGAITPLKIARFSAEVAGITLENICSQRRCREFAWPRMAGMALACDHTPHSLPQIGRAFGDRDHSTVVHARDTSASKLQHLEYAAAYRAIEAKIIATKQAA